jgi:hypothetical protein
MSTNQTSGGLTEIGSNLYELIKARGIIAYPDPDLRLAISRAERKSNRMGYFAAAAIGTVPSIAVELCRARASAASTFRAARTAAR